MQTLDSYVGPARTFAEQLQNLEGLTAFMQREGEKYPDKIRDLFFHFSYFDLGNGVIGHCLYLAEMDHLFPDEGYDQAAHHLLQQVINGQTLPYLDDSGLWTGLAGICFTIEALSKKGTRYIKILQKLHEKLVTVTSEKLTEAEGHLAAQQVKMPDYDWMAGLAGTSLYLTEAAVRHPALQKISQQVIDYLCSLVSGTKEVNGTVVPIWHIAAEDQFLEGEKTMYPDGNVNLGISHGMTGVLCALVRAKKVQRDHEELSHAIRTLTDWFIAQHGKTSDGQLCWEKRMPFSTLARAELQQPLPNPSWCYGDLMIAKALWDAGEVLEDERLQNFALACLESLQPVLLQSGLIAPTYCHGIAGVLHVVDAMYKKTKRAYLAEMTIQLQTQLEAYYKEEAKFGFCDVEAMDNARFTFQKPGLLTGAAGIYLTLLSVGKPSSHTGWERLFAVD